MQCKCICSQLVKLSSANLHINRFFSLSLSWVTLQTALQTEKGSHYYATKRMLLFMWRPIPVWMPAQVMIPSWTSDVFDLQTDNLGSVTTSSVWQQQHCCPCMWIGKVAQVVQARWFHQFGPATRLISRCFCWCYANAYRHTSDRDTARADIEVYLAIYRHNDHLMIFDEVMDRGLRGANRNLPIKTRRLAVAFIRLLLGWSCKVCCAQN